MLMVSNTGDRLLLKERLPLVGLLVACAMLLASCAGGRATAPEAGVAADVTETNPPPVLSSTVVTTSAPAPGRKLLAHRGVHQTFDPEGVDDQTCTATRIDPPAHGYIENTIASMEAAFLAGAEVVEIDIARTVDGVLAVFHDWEVGCRTNGVGEIRSLTWDELSKLDIGYGYTPDGTSYPLRGKGQGLMPRLEQVFAAFPEGQFLIHFKSDAPSEVALLQQVVESAGAGDQVWAVYGAQQNVEAYVSATGARGFSEASITACLTEFLTSADSGAFPLACEDTIVAVPLDLAPALTGWPGAFVQSMTSHGTDVIVSGPGLTGIDTSTDFDLLPQDVDLYVWTDKVEALS